MVVFVVVVVVNGSVCCYCCRCCCRCCCCPYFSPVRRWTALLTLANPPVPIVSRTEYIPFRTGYWKVKDPVLPRRREDRPPDLWTKRQRDIEMWRILFARDGEKTDHRICGQRDKEILKCEGSCSPATAKRQTTGPVDKDGNALELWNRCKMLFVMTECRIWWEFITGNSGVFTVVVIGLTLVDYFNHNSIGKKYSLRRIFTSNSSAQWTSVNS